MAEPQDDAPEGRPLNGRAWDLLIFIPAGLAVSAMEELPRLAAKGREHLGVRVSSARAVGLYAVKTGRRELRRRSGGLLGGSPASPAGSGRDGMSGPPGAGAPDGVRPELRPPVAVSEGNGHVPPVSALAIPGFDTLSASQVVQRLDGLNRAELVSVRAYEASTRGRRTILSRVDQLLDERS
ncbi:MAG: hypothetical protein ACRDYE_05895 [Acidimicrobiales bacterium]